MAFLEKIHFLSVISGDATGLGDTKCTGNRSNEVAILGFKISPSLTDGKVGGVGLSCFCFLSILIELSHRVSCVHFEFSRTIWR